VEPQYPLGASVKRQRFPALRASERAHRALARTLDAEAGVRYAESAAFGLLYGRAPDHRLEKTYKFP
jgi:hypothetical protein